MTHRGAPGSTASRSVNIFLVSEAADLRASDEERERVALEMREHFAAGRLSADELGDRLEATYRARTDAELQAVRADLPASPAAARAELARRRATLQRELVQQTGGALVPFFVCVVIWVATGADGAFWPIWVVLAALFPLLHNGWRLYGPAPELDRVEADLARRREEGARDARRRHGHHPHR
jgi:hypothetical protein